MRKHGKMVGTALAVSVVVGVIVGMLGVGNAATLSSCSTTPKITPNVPLYSLQSGCYGGTFSGTAGQQVWLVISAGSDFSGRAEVQLSGTNTSITGSFLLGSLTDGVSSGAVTLPAAGTYKVIVNALQPSIGTVTGSIVDTDPAPPPPTESPTV